jgi:hypothetical protein
MVDERACMGGRALFPDEILLKEWLLKAWAKDGNDWGACVVMLAWLTDMATETGDTDGVVVGGLWSPGRGKERGERRQQSRRAFDGCR